MCGFCNLCVCVGFVICVFAWVLYYVCLCGLCNLSVYEGFVIFGCFGNVYSVF
jgi:hypothetical protein